MTETVRLQLVALLPRMRRFAFGLTGSQDEADDLVQAACERSLSRLHQWQPDTRLDSWMYRIVQTLWIDRLRSRKTRGEAVDPELLERLPAGDGNPAESQHTLAVVTAAMEQLPEEQRLVLVLVSVEGMSYQEAAEVLEVPIGTVMSRLARARKQLHALVHGQDRW